MRLRPQHLVVAMFPKGVACTKFDAQAEFEDGQIHVSIDTDLPPEVDVSLIVSREYFEKGNKDAYAVEYVDEESPVSDWTDGRDFEISNAQAMETYSKKQEELAARGLAEPLDHFSDSIEVWLLVRLSEPKASGSCMLNDDGDLEKTWKFAYSLDAKPKPIETLDPEGLVNGDRFRLTDDTPLMPDPNPADPEAALGQVVTLRRGTPPDSDLPNFRAYRKTTAMSRCCNVLVAGKEPVGEGEP